MAMATQILKAPPITVEQYEHFEGYPGLRDELIFGEIVMSPQPKPLHQQIAENVHFLLKQALEGQSFVAKQSSNIKFRDANSMPAPDIFVVSRSDWRRACESDQYLDTAPVVTVEVVSPANRKGRVEQKIELYLAEGVQQVWVIHPKKKIVLVHATTEGVKHATEWSEGTLELPRPLQGSVTVGEIFSLD
jgi:Uma2 family endonuclease